MDFDELVAARRSHRSYVPGKAVSPKVLVKLLEQAALAPSSMNMQGWSALVVADPKEKERLHREACQQQQVLDSSAVIVVCGNLEQYKNIPEIVQNTSTMDDSLRKMFVKNGADIYASDPQAQRDEAFRSAMLFAMSFMFAATNAGFGTCPIGGFDREKLVEAFGIKAPLIPVLLVSLGTVRDAPFPRAYRRPVDQFARFI